MISSTAARISWLFPVEREVYRILRTAPTVDLERLVEHGGAPCLRCGSPVTEAGSGARRAVFFYVRDRGSRCRRTEVGAIHRGCVPDRETTARGIPARARHASQVRA